MKTDERLRKAQENGGQDEASLVPGILMTEFCKILERGGIFLPKKRPAKTRNYYKISKVQLEKINNSTYFRNLIKSN